MDLAMNYLGTIHPSLVIHTPLRWLADWDGNDIFDQKIKNKIASFIASILLVILIII